MISLVSSPKFSLSLSARTDGLIVLNANEKSANRTCALRFIALQVHLQEVEETKYGIISSSLRAICKLEGVNEVLC